MKVSIITILLFSCLKLAALGYDNNSVVEQFYSKLLADQPPTVAEEKEFFGSNPFIKFLLQRKPEFKNSHTPIWDFLRQNKALFIPLNFRSQKEIIISEPFGYKALGTQTPKQGRHVLVFFLSDRNDAKSGFRTLLFSLPEDNSPLYIEGTCIHGLEGKLLGQFIIDNMTLEEMQEMQKKLTLEEMQEMQKYKY